jgi:hypothetical protein
VRCTLFSKKLTFTHVNGSTANGYNAWVDIEVWGKSDATTYVGNILEWSGAISSMLTYYYAGTERVAMHRGSSNVITGSNGTKIACWQLTAMGSGLDICSVLIKFTHSESLP